MGIKYRIIPDCNLITVICAGKIGVSDYEIFFKKIRNDPQYHAGLNTLVNAKKLEIEYRYHDLRAIVDLVNEFQPKPQDAKVAVLVISTVFAVATDAYNLLQKDYQVKPFKKLEKAKKWLELPDDLKLDLEED